MNELSRIDSRIAQGTVPLYIDNESALKLTKNPEAHARTRHIDIQHHYVCEEVEAGRIEPIWILGQSNPADMLTKALPAPALRTYCEFLGITNSTTFNDTTADARGWGGSASRCSS